MTDGELFTAACQALWGDNWKGEAERELAVRKTTISEWSRGKGAPVPAGIWIKIGAFLEQRHLAIEKMLPRIEKAKAAARAREIAKTSAPPREPALYEYRMTHRVRIDDAMFQKAKDRFESFARARGIVGAAARMIGKEAVFEIRTHLTAAQMNSLGDVFGPLSAELDTTIGLTRSPT